MEIERTLDTVTAEILIVQENVRRTVYGGCIKIGKCLQEAKEMVPQGGWGEYLENVLHLKPSTAQNYMRIAREFGSDQVGLDGASTSQIFGELSYTQLIPLLGVSEEERVELAEENDLGGMSSREVAKLVADYKAAQAALAAAERREQDAIYAQEKADKASEKADKALEDMEAARAKLEAENRKLTGRVNELTASGQRAQAALSAAEEAKREIEERLAEMENAEPLTAEVVPDEETLQKIREQIAEEQAQAVRDAEERAAEAAKKLEKAKNPDAARVNFLFGEVREDVERLRAALDSLGESDAETEKKFRGVIAKWFAGTAAEVEE